MAALGGFTDRGGRMLMSVVAGPFPSKWQAAAKERILIRRYKTCQREYGYNTMLGAPQWDKRYWGMHLGNQQQAHAAHDHPTGTREVIDLTGD